MSDSSNINNSSDNRIVLASGNAGKLREMGAMLGALNWELVAQGELGVRDAIEDGLSFIENALIKARHASSHTNLPAIADDSGLVVPALRGAPGIYSARYAGIEANDTDNNAKLLREMEKLGGDARAANFRCAIAFVRHANDPVPVIAEGVWHGRILDAPRGDNGFGYDPLFFVAEHDCASAELSSTVKNSISHRGQAMAQLQGRLQDAGLNRDAS